MKCPNCLEEIPDNNTICPKCGTSLLKNAPAKLNPAQSSKALSESKAVKPVSAHESTTLPNPKRIKPTQYGNQTRTHTNGAVKTSTTKVQPNLKKEVVPKSPTLETSIVLPKSVVEPTVSEEKTSFPKESVEPVNSEVQTTHSPSEIVVSTPTEEKINLEKVVTESAVSPKELNLPKEVVNPSLPEVKPVNPNEVVAESSVPVENQTPTTTEPVTDPSTPVAQTSPTTAVVNTAPEPKPKKTNGFITKLKEFFIIHKKKIIIGTSLCLTICVALLLFFLLYDFTEIKWDMDRGDAKLDYTEGTTLKLNVLAYDREKNRILDIEFTTEDGTLEADDDEVEWHLPNKEGTYTIYATAPSGKQISKTINVIKLDSIENNQQLAGIIEDEVDDEITDNDNDGLMNAEEIKLGTNKDDADTDSDGLPDKFEIEKTQTDPLKADTDNDGIRDGDELDLGLDPLKADSKGDGLKDSERDLTYTIEEKDLGVTIEINGKGNIASSTIDLVKNNTFNNMDGLLDTIYSFYSTGKINNAKVTIKYDIEDITKKGLNEDNLTLYYFNEETKKLEAMPTTVDKENKTITVTLKHFSKYVIGDNNVVLTDNNSQIMFIIDNSVSMYSEEQMIEAGYDDSQGAVGNDTEFKRLSLTNKLIDMFTGNYEFGVAEFSGNYVNLSKFTKDTKTVKKAVNSMESKWNSNANGTNITSSLDSGINEFNNKQNNNYIVLLTDGKNTFGSISSKKASIIKNAQDKNVKICVIGLGDKIDTNDLNEIAEETGCDYYNASNSSALDEIYSKVGASINYSLVDTDNDNKADGMIEADSGFIVTRDGFSFSNFSSNKSEGGHCYGMATFAMLYYTDSLPLSLPKAHKWDVFHRYEASNGYNLEGTFIARKENLYDYKITNEALQILLSPDKPADYRDRVENKTLMINKKYVKKLEKIGTTFSIKKTSNGKDFNKYQSALLNIDNDTFNNAVVKDESQLLNAFYRLFILQVNDKVTGFSAYPDKAFKELNEGLSAGKPLILAINHNHGINATKLIRDINDANKFKIEVYDNNYPGETRYIEVSRSKYNKIALDYTAWVNEYKYTFYYDSNNDGEAEKMDVSICYPTIE